MSFVKFAEIYIKNLHIVLFKTNNQIVRIYTTTYRIRHCQIVYFYVD